LVKNVTRGVSVACLPLLRAHGIIQKVTGTHRYLLSPRGRQILTALQAARRASIDQLLKIAGMRKSSQQNNTLRIAVQMKKSEFKWLIEIAGWLCY
jgi:hypothetical protein